MRSSGRSSMNFETTALTTSMRLTRWRSTLKSNACIDPETSSPSTISMPFAVTSVRLWDRCGRASPAIIKAQARTGNNHCKRPTRLRLPRATSRARLTSEYSMAATGPRHSMKTGSSASSQNHSGCRKRSMSLLSRGRFFRPRRGQYENARALAQRFHILLVERHRREFDEIALIQELCEQRLMTGKRCIRRFQQIAQKLLGSSPCDADRESLFDVAAHDV